ncbi:glycosyltransferase [Candidatus Thioglobus sp.]|nr:glycosyltransferase [Candidatus Thioglobus sp.]
MHVGKFKDQKRHDILIKSYAKSNIKEKLVLVGQGPLEEKSRDLVKKLNIKDKVIFSGFQNNPYPYMKNAKFMVLSSEFEGLGMVILESLALNTPVISTDCNSGPREILPKKNLTPVNDVNALALRISDASNNTINYSCNIRKEFLLENVVKEYIKLTCNTM